MILETTDRVYRLQGRLIDRRGKEMWVHARYVAYWIFLGTGPLITLVALAIPRGPKLSTSIVFGLCGGSLCAYYLANRLTGDITPRGLYETTRSELQTWVACRLAAAAAPRQQAARHPSTSGICTRWKDLP